MDRSSVWRGLAVACVVFALGLGTGQARAQDASDENCVVSQVGNNIAQRMGQQSRNQVREMITPALRKYNLGCLARTISMGGFGRIGGNIGGALRRIIDAASGNGLCQVILDAITEAGGPETLWEQMKRDAELLATERLHTPGAEGV